MRFAGALVAHLCLERRKMGWGTRQGRLVELPNLRDGGGAAFGSRSTARENVSHAGSQQDDDAQYQRPDAVCNLVGAKAPTAILLLPL